MFYVILLSSMALLPALHTAPEIADFMAFAEEFLPPHERAPYTKLVSEVTAGHHPAGHQLVESARMIGVLTWPKRRALSLFLNGAGAKIEWDTLLATVRPKTAQALKRLHKDDQEQTIDEALASSDAATLIHEDEEIEIAAERSRAQLALWKKHEKELAPLVTQAEHELEALQKRFKGLREQAARSMHEHDLINSKLAQFEDRVYFRGEHIPLEILDHELAFDVEANELPVER